MSAQGDSALSRWRHLDGDRRKALFKAVFKLACARLRLARKPIQPILLSLSEPPQHAANDDVLQEVETAAWAIAAAAARVPWRSDCLLQAMAAADWLCELSAQWEFCLGVRRTETGQLEAHAWLKSHDRVVTGNLPDLETFALLPVESITASELHFAR